MDGLILKVVIVLFGTIVKIQCERFPDFFGEKELSDIFGPSGFNKDHPYRQKKAPERPPEPKFAPEKPVYSFGRQMYADHNLEIPALMTYSKGPGRSGPVIPPEERIFPDPVWPPQDSSTDDLAELPKRLSKTKKWGEFKALLKEERKKHPKGTVMKNWEQDVEKWAGYSRQLLVRDEYQKEKALRSQQAQKMALRQRAATPPPERPVPSPGMNPYWAEEYSEAEPQPPAPPSTRKPMRAITAAPFYIYNTPSNYPSYRRMDEEIPGQPGYPVDENPTYGGEERDMSRSRKGGAIPMGPRGYPGTRAENGAPPEYGGDYPPDYGDAPPANMPPRQMPGYGSDQRALRMGPAGGGGSNMPGYGPGRPGYGEQMGPPPGFGPPGYGGPPMMSGAGGPPGYGPTFRGSSPQFRPRTQGYMGGGVPGGPPPYEAPGGPGGNGINHNAPGPLPNNRGVNLQASGAPTGQDLLKMTRQRLAVYSKIEDKLKLNNSNYYTTRPPPMDLKSQLLALPESDDFGAPIKWVKFNSHETVDGLAKVTDPTNMRNQQHIIEGSIYVPIVDHSVLRLGLTTHPPTTLGPVKSTPYPNHETIQTMLRSIDLNRTNEMDWLAVEAVTLEIKKEIVKDCSGEGCQARCRRMNCESTCDGDTCGSGCIGVSCNAFCKGPGCLSMCIGEFCTTKCDGESCNARCWGKGCEASCSKFGCQQSTNGVFKQSVMTWDQAYPQYGGGAPQGPPGPPGRMRAFGGPGSPHQRAKGYADYDY